MELCTGLTSMHNALDALLATQAALHAAPTPAAPPAGPSGAGAAAPLPPIPRSASPSPEKPFAVATALVAAASAASLAEGVAAAGGLGRSRSAQVELQPLEGPGRPARQQQHPIRQLKHQRSLSEGASLLRHSEGHEHEPSELAGVEEAPLAETAGGASASWAAPPQASLLWGAGGACSR